MDTKVIQQGMEGFSKNQIEEIKKGQEAGIAEEILGNVGFQVERLRTLGCDYVQGYYFAKPMAVEEYEALLMI